VELPYVKRVVYRGLQFTVKMRSSNPESPNSECRSFNGVSSKLKCTRRFGTKKSAEAVRSETMDTHFQSAQERKHAPYYSVVLLTLKQKRLIVGKGC
jgi:hypothetical protein